MEKREEIERLYFLQKRSLTQIAEEMKLSISYISRILRENTNYHDEQEKRKQENKEKRRAKQKELIYTNRKEKARQSSIDNLIMQNLHEQASIELSKRSALSKEALRKWCSLYKYNKQKKCYEFDSSKTVKPNDFPLYIKT